MLMMQPVLRKRLRGIERLVREGKDAADKLQKIGAEIEAAAQRCDNRLVNLPLPTYPEHLPVSEQRERIKTAICGHQVVIIAGETGSGKTTQLPKICLELGRGVMGMIGHTQPRRIAARTLAMRIASELNSSIGHAVGYKVRFSDRMSPDSYVKVMTDGILLAESQGDRDLLAYDTLIIDEAHERSLNIDFLLGYVRQLLPKRPDLKVIITSATIDTERFARHFANAPVIEVSGRSYPVEVRYRPLLGEDADAQDRDMEQAIIDAVDELGRHDRQGDILIFLPGERDIRNTAEALRKHHPPSSEIISLFARQSAEEQNRVFHPGKGRRIVLATNVAETSLTVPGIRYVVDTGQARISRYSYRSKVQRLPIEAVSRASADQRKGRCGRVAPGVCIRLYSEQDYLGRTEFTDPEIRRTNLASVILQMQLLGLGEVADFPFIDPPDARAITDGYRLLQELGAVDAGQHITELGRQVAKLPVDPRLGRMIIAAAREGSLHEVLVIVAALSVQDPRDRPQEHQQAADQAHHAWRDEKSDFLFYLNLWRCLEEQRRHLTRNKLRQWCKANFLSFVRINEWLDIHHQLVSQISEMQLRMNVESADYGAIHRALLTGLLGHLGLKTEKDEFLGARGSPFYVFPGSALRKKPPHWLMAAEIVETTRLYARTVAAIEPEWIERAAGVLCKRSYSDPHWEKRRSQVVALEKLTLYGLPIVLNRKVHYGPIDPLLSREVFIREALVAGEFTTRAGFFAHNLKLLLEVESMEDKTRRRDILVDEHALFEFYDQRVPQGIYSGVLFERWREQAEREAPQLLFLRKQDLMRQEAGLDTSQFPDFVLVGAMRIPLSYRFAPGEPDDGVSARIPLGSLNALSATPFEWLVPGLLKDKIQFLIKALPKSLRKHFVPAPDYAEACTSALAPSEKPFIEAVIQQLLRISGVQLKPADWAGLEWPPHLLMHFEILDDAGKTIDSGRHLPELQQRLSGMTRQTLSAAAPASQWERTGVIDWDFGELPTTVQLKQSGMLLTGYPALIDQGQSVDIKLLESPERAQSELQGGMLRLFMLQCRDKIKYLRKNLPNYQKLVLLYTTIGGGETLIDDVITVAAREVFMRGELPGSPTEFQQRLQAGEHELVAKANQVAELAFRILTALQRVRQVLKTKTAPQWLFALQDIRQQLDQLIYPGFIRLTPMDWLEYFPRYLTAIEKRVEKLGQNFAEERAHILELQKYWQQYQERLAKHQRQYIHDEELAYFRWMLEEYRVSLFAQSLKTAIPVSAQRLTRQWEKIRD